jgi:hypothetical protein
MAAATLTPTEDQIFDAVWGFLDTVFGSTISANIFKGFQNMTATPAGTSYIVVSPGIVVRQNQIVRDYDAVNGLTLNERDTEYSYQVDCYGPSGPDYANTVAIAWRTLWACDYFAGNNLNPPPGAPLPVTPLYADEPQQLNIVNGELQYEQRFMLKLHLQANQVVALPQDFFTTAPSVTLVVADDLSA